MSGLTRTTDLLHDNLSVYRSELIDALETLWIPVTDTWTYNAADKINVPSDATVYMQKGVKIRLKQGGGYKHFYGTDIAATLLTVNGGIDFTVANLGITDISYSYGENPFGFPAKFNWLPTRSGYSVNPPSATYRFRVVQGHCEIFMFEDADGTSNAVTKTYTLPIVPAESTRLSIPLPINNGTIEAAGVAVISSGSLTMSCSRSAAAAWTASGACRMVSIQGSYLI